MDKIMFNIMRYPVLMEDEGRHFFIRACETLEEAKKWIKDQEKEYFKPGDYYITAKERE